MEEGGFKGLKFGFGLAFRQDLVEKWMGGVGKCGDLREVGAWGKLVVIAPR